MDIEHAGQDEKKEPTTQTVVVSTADTYQTSFCTQVEFVTFSQYLIFQVSYFWLL